MPDAAIPRILLFGRPSSGKSALLGALARAGETQGETLGAEVIDPTGRLPHLRDHLYAGAALPSTHAELVSHEIRLRPWRIGARPVMEPLAVAILDCGGAAASALLKHPDPITERGVRGTLAAAVVQSDLIALVVNAGAGDRELDDAFDEFLMFLERVHGRKAFEREVGGFPIFLVLAQCDRLAGAGDSPEQWQAAIQKRLRHAVRKFADFLDEPPAAGSHYLPFGSVELQGYAVAVRTPDFSTGSAAPASEPFGVAELFRDAFAAAKRHRDRARDSHRRLRGTIAAVAAAIGLLFAGAVAVEWLQPQPADPGLAEQVQAFWEREPPAAVRLAAKNIARNRRRLTAFRSDPGFLGLPEELRSFVDGRLHEIDEYQAYAAKLNAAPGPDEARSLEQLARCENLLNGELALPVQYTWGETEAAQLRDKRLADIPLLRTAAAAWQDWYRGLDNQALALTHTRSFAGDWGGRVAAVDAAAQRPPFDAEAPIPGSRILPQLHGEAVTYRTAAEFDGVYQAERDWEFARSRLLELRDFAAALGLTDDPARGVLVIPPPGPDVEAAKLPGERLHLLTGSEHRAWQLANFPEPGRALLAARLHESFDNGVKLARPLIAAKRTGDSPADWRKLADALEEPAIRDWGRLLQLLDRCEHPRAADPVAELAAFLRIKEFALEPKSFDLAIPLALRVPAVIPAGTLTITVQHGDAPAAELVFKPVGEAATQGLNAVYRLVPESLGALRFAPGDSFKMELPVRSGDQRFTLRWEDGANRNFPFDRWLREPKLVPVLGPAEPATGVALAPGAGSNLPRLPVLLVGSVKP